VHTSKLMRVIRMNREIKFRGKIKEGYENAGQWVYFSLEDFIDSNLFGECSDALTLNHIDMKTVGQFTGLKDKNGKEIYEGDILAYPDKRKKTRVVVRWVGVAYCEEYGTYAGFVIPEDYINMVVIGNIYENPELLEGDKDGRTI